MGEAIKMAWETITRRPRRARVLVGGAGVARILMDGCLAVEEGMLEHESPRYWEATQANGVAVYAPHCGGR